MDCSPPGSPVHGIFQARALEWGAIAFSGTCFTMVLVSAEQHSYLLLFSHPVVFDSL